MNRCRIAIHALDRTGPPMLALAWLRWMRSHLPEEDVEVVAFRGGPLLNAFLDLAPVHVLLDPDEPWSHELPDARRTEIVRRRAGGLGPATRTVLVSVSAGQVLPYVIDGGETVAWVVEQGEDLHWIDGPLDLRRRVDRWLAGSCGTGDELSRRGVEVDGIAPEFVGLPQVSDELAARCRVLAGADDGTLLVVGAGIATFRKAPDLFVEVALAWRRAHRGPAKFVWLGGERDDLFHLVRDEVERLGLEEVRLVGEVADPNPWLAAADVMLHPARLDAFPLVCLAAAALGTPVVGFDGAGGLREMFGDHFAGAPYPDVAGLAATLADVAVAGGDLGERQGERIRAAHVAETAAPELWRALSGAGQ